MYTIDILNKICRFVKESPDCEAIGTIVAFKNKPYKELLINFLEEDEGHIGPEYDFLKKNSNDWNILMTNDEYQKLRDFNSLWYVNADLVISIEESNDNKQVIQTSVDESGKIIITKL